jgi:hypothetical protein
VVGEPGDGPGRLVGNLPCRRARPLVLGYHPGCRHAGRARKQCGVRRGGRRDRTGGPNRSAGRRGRPRSPRHGGRWPAGGRAVDRRGRLTRTRRSRHRSRLMVVHDGVRDAPAGDHRAQTPAHSHVSPEPPTATPPHLFRTPHDRWTLLAATASQGDTHPCHRSLSSVLRGDLLAGVVEVHRCPALLTGPDHLLEVAGQVAHVELRDSFVSNVGLQARRVEPGP